MTPVCTVTLTHGRPYIYFLSCLIVHLITYIHCDNSTVTTELPIVTPAITVCPHQCVCMMTSYAPVIPRELFTVQCIGKALQVIPQSLLQENEALIVTGNRIKVTLLVQRESDEGGLLVLDVSDNHVYSIREWRLKLPALRLLRLDSNLIDSLPNGSFHYTRNLLELSITNNNLEIIESGAFRGLISLRYMYLSHNRIEGIKSAWFEDMPALQTLDLNSNQIGVIWDNTLQYAYNLINLNVSSNQIAHIYDTGLSGAHNIKVLNLSHNHLKRLPIPSFASFINASSIDISYNYFTKVPENSFVHVNVSKLYINSQPRLLYIDQRAFVNLPFLKTLQISHNPSLLYVAPTAFSNLAAIRTLDMSSNNLTVLEEPTYNSLRNSLSRLILADNPLVCDCTTSWIPPALSNSSYPSSPACVNNSFSGTSTAVADNSCAPHTVVLSSRPVQVSLGDNLVLPCRGFGSPEPNITWQRVMIDKQSNEQQMLSVINSPGTRNATSTQRVYYEPNGDLTIDYVMASDSGVYTCTATNHNGSFASRVEIRVTDADVRVIITHVTSHSITMTWKRTSYSSQQTYQIRVKPAAQNATFRTIDIKPYMRGYTASRLDPHQQYEICMTSKHHNHYVILSCTRVNTHEKLSGQPGIFNARNLIVGVGVTVLVLVACVACCATFVVKRYNKKKRRQADVYGDNSSRLCLSSGDSMSDMSPITYENRAAEMFDEDDLDEIHESASMASLSIVNVNRHAVMQM